MPNSGGQKGGLPWTPQLPPGSADLQPGIVRSLAGGRRFREMAWAELADGRRLLLHRVVAAQYGVDVGAQLDQPQLAAIWAAEAVERAREDGLRLLALRPRTVADLHRCLRRRGHEPAAIEATIDTMNERALLDDLALAKAYIRQWTEAGQWGADRMVARLRQLGVPAAVLAEVKDELPDTDAAAQRAMVLVRARAGRLPTGNRRAAARRLLAFLERRGFPGEVAWKAVRTVLGETDSPEA